MIFDHIGIFVKNIAFGEKHLHTLLPICKSSKVYEDPLLNVYVKFCYDANGVCYELVAPFGENNPVDTALKNNNILTNFGKIEIGEASKIELSKYEYAPEFNKLFEAQKVTITFSKTLNTTIFI